MNHDNPDRLARAALTYLAEPADKKLAALVRAVGAARAVQAITAGQVPERICHPSFGIEEVLARWRQRLSEIPGPGQLAGFARQGIRLVCPGDPEWPSRLEELKDVPYALWLRGNGDLRHSCLRSVAVVGSRAATSYGSYMAAELAASLAGRGWTIVSGGAYGIDAAAHRGALGAGGGSVAVLACGVDRPYPAGHADLIDAIAADGVVVSEWPPGRNATRLRFLKRNRVMAALTTGTLVVEAGRRSGALNTGQYARELGRPLMAVPGPATSEMSAGCHHMIRNWDAALITTAAEVDEYLNPIGAAVQQRAVAHQQVLPWDDLDPDMKVVLDAVPVRRGASTEDIAKRAGVDLPAAFGSLGALAAGGFVQRCPQGWRVRRGYGAGARGGQVD